MGTHRASLERKNEYDHGIIQAPSGCHPEIKEKTNADQEDGLETIFIPLNSSEHCGEVSVPHEPMKIFIA